LKAAKVAKRKERRERHILKNYELLTIEDKEYIIPKKEETEANPLIFLYKEIFDKVYDDHCSQGHRC
jgi:hypothetical protein